MSNTNSSTTEVKQTKAPIKGESTAVTMEDGRIVDFPAKRKMQKTLTSNEDGSISIRVDFINGTTLSFTVPVDNFLNYALYGLSQKTSDTMAGIPQIDDCVLAIESLFAQLARGEWTTRSSGNSFSGMSILALALTEHSGQSPEKVKAFLLDKTQGQKLALRNSAEIKPIVTRLEVERAAKNPKANIDTTALLDGLGTSTTTTTTTQADAPSEPKGKKVK